MLILNRCTAFASLATIVAFAACQSNPTGPPSASSGDGGRGGGQATSAGGDASTSSTTDTITVTTGSGGSDPGCVDIEVGGDPIVRPADIIFVVDNSGSMNQEIASIEQNINTNFAQIISASGIDYQVIMLTDHGSASTEVCIGAPLSNTNNCNGPPGDTPAFHHYDTTVQSWNSACKVLDTLYGPADQQGLHPEGWSKWLRQNALKFFVEITDDRMNCGAYNDFSDANPSANQSQAAAAAVAWDQALRQAAPAQFGTSAVRNYIFHSIIGVAENSPNATEPYEAWEPIVGGTGPGAVNAGFGYQWLSKGTGGLRFPVSQFASYDAVFQAIAAGVVQGAEVPCEVDISQASDEIDLNSLIVEYTSDDMSPVVTFDLRSSIAACGQADDAFYIEDDVLKLCPATCERVTDDASAKLKVVAQCVDIAN